MDINGTAIAGASRPHDRGSMSEEVSIVEARHARRPATLACTAAALAVIWTVGIAQQQTQGEARPTSRAIASAVERELHDDHVSLDDVRVVVEDQKATLTGTVGNLIAYERAEKIAETVKGVRSVANELHVRPERGVASDALATRTKEALIVNAATEAFDVDVSNPSYGVVRLTGHVDSWPERILVDRVAKSVAGVIEVRNDVIVDFTRARSDDELEAEIAAMLRWDLYVDGGLIRVAADEGRVELAGLVGSAAEKRRARAIAWTSGVKSVDTSALEVVEWARDDRLKDLESDSENELEIAVMRALANHPYVQSRIAASIDAGVVTLRGDVLSLGEKRAAVAAVYSIMGVESVRDRMRVRSVPAAGKGFGRDERIERAVVSALRAHAVTEARDIAVEVERGVVDLYGDVDNAYERSAADTVAASVRGVRQVNNRLTVTTDDEWLSFNPYVDEWPANTYVWYDPRRRRVWTEDTALVREVREQLKWSPYVEADKIQVTAHDGVIVLEGTVDTDRQRRVARANAMASGAAQVVDRLEVN